MLGTRVEGFELSQAHRQSSRLDNEPNDSDNFERIQMWISRHIHYGFDTCGYILMSIIHVYNFFQVDQLSVKRKC